MNDRVTRTKDARSNNLARMHQAAERWITYDKSDPFTRNRVYSHIANGIATPMRASRCAIEQYNRDDHGKAITPANGQLDAYYDCEQDTVETSYINSDGVKVTKKTPVFLNMIRP